MSNKQELLKQALFYLENKISVIPVGKDKKPLINWKEYQDRLATNEEVEDWFEKYEDAQVGVVTGKISNLIVVDVEAGGKIDWLPETATSKTGGGGYHFWYTYVDGIKNKTRIRELTDIRGDGGYAIAPPSKTDKGEYSWLKKIKLKKFPAELFEENIYNKQSVATQVNINYKGYGEGNRNSEMARYIGYVLTKVHPSEWDTIAYSVVAEANKKNTPPLSSYELATTFKSICGMEAKNNNDRWYKKNEEQTWEGEEDEVLPIYSVAEKQDSKRGVCIPTGLQVFDEALGGGVELGDLVTIAAPTGNGKTSLSQFFTKKFNDLVIPSLWFSYEVMVVNLIEKFKEIGVTNEWMTIYSPLKNTSGDVAWIEKKIIEAKKKYNVGLVVIDHLGFLLPKAKTGNQNQSGYLAQICRELKQIALEYEVIIVMPVHMRKTDNPSLNDIYNSVGIAQESDVVFILSREENDSESDEYYTDYSMITLSKNRKTGVTTRAWFNFVNGNYIYDPYYKGVQKRKKPGYFNKNKRADYLYD